RCRARARASRDPTSPAAWSRPSRRGRSRRSEARPCANRSRARWPSARRTGRDPAPGAGLTWPLLHASSLPWPVVGAERRLAAFGKAGERAAPLRPHLEVPARGGEGVRSEEHTSELQSREKLVCRLLLEQKKHV